MIHSGCEEYKLLVQSLIGSYNNPVDRMKQRFSIQETLDLFSTSLEQKYVALTIDKKWNGASNKASVFKTETQEQDSTRQSGGDRNRSGNGRERKHKYPSREAWFDAQVCGTCGGKHPTWAHDDPVGKRSGSTKPAANRQKRKFSKAKLTRRVREAVHNILLEAQVNDQDEMEEEHYANMAGSAEFEAIKQEDGDADEDGSDSEVEDTGISALVAAALGNLLKE